MQIRFENVFAIFAHRMADELIRVLVQMGDNRKPVCFVSDPEEADLAVLQRAIASVVKIELREGEYILVQTKSEEWVGEWVDLEEEERVVDKSVLKAKICQVCCICIYQLESWFT